MKLRKAIIDNLIDGYMDQVVNLWRELDSREDYMFPAKATSLALSIERDLEEMAQRGWLDQAKAEEIKAEFERQLDDYFHAWEEEELEL